MRNKNVDQKVVVEPCSVLLGAEVDLKFYRSRDQKPPVGAYESFVLRPYICSGGSMSIIRNSNRTYVLVLRRTFGNGQKKERKRNKSDPVERVARAP